MNKIKLTRVLAKKLYPLTIAIAGLISLATPITYYAIESQSLKKTTHLYAEELADDFRRLTKNNPRLWQYQHPKFDGIISNFAHKKKLISIQISNKQNQPIRGYEYHNQNFKNWKKHYISECSTPIIFNNRTIGNVRVTISQADLISKTFWLFLFSSATGISLAILVYRFPLKIVDRQEKQIQQLFDSLSFARNESESMRQAAENSKNRLKELVQGLNGIVWEADPLSKKFLFVSQPAEDILGYPVRKWLEDPNFRDKLIFPEDREIANSFYSSEILTKNKEIVIEYRAFTAKGNLIWLRDSIHIIKDKDNQSLLLRGISVDITARKQAEQQLEYTAFHDPLTGLLNRASFLNRLDRVIKLAKERDDYVFAVLYLDLDRFKIVNDSLGHPIGDELLISVAERLVKAVRGKDKVARLGGDEFVILLENISGINLAISIAQRIISQLQKPYYLRGYEVVVTASIGIASSATIYDRAEEILRDADNALYAAKNLGKNRYELFDETMHAKVLARLQIENDLRKAIELNQIEVYYQPIIDLKEQVIFGFEALARWHHPERGFISPAEFIPIAEENGSIVELTNSVLQAACRQFLQWQERYGRELTLSVNISAVQFSRPNFVATISKILEETGFDPQYLILEITETTIIKDLDLAKLIIQELLDRKIKIAMDDFGTGYSSLSYLYQLPIDKIKVDRSFIKDLECDREKLEVIKAIANLANGLGMNLVAEGIETKKQLEIVRQLNCHYGQGYLFSKPANSERAEAIIAFERQTIEQI